MRLINAQIKNYKGIEQLRLQFNPGFHLIRGAGQATSILEALATALCGFTSEIEGVSTRHFSKDEIRKVYSMSDDGSCECSYFVPLEVTIVTYMDGVDIPLRWTRGKSSIHASKSNLLPREVANLARRFARRADHELPLLSYQGVGRAWSPGQEKTDNVFRKKQERTIGYTDALAGTTNISLLLNWCAKMEQTARQQEAPAAEYEAVMNTVSGFINRIIEGEHCKFFYNRKSCELMYQNNGLILPVGNLGVGFQTLAWMVFDIACRMAILNPHMQEDIAKAKGIVLIDELDMHLRPEWHSKVIDALREVFPNIQFIVTTRSQTLLTAAKEVHIIDIVNNEPEYSDLK